MCVWKNEAICACIHLSMAPCQAWSISGCRDVPVFSFTICAVPLQVRSSAVGEIDAASSTCTCTGAFCVHVTSCYLHTVFALNLLFLHRFSVNLVNVKLCCLAEPWGKLY